MIKKKTQPPDRKKDGGGGGGGHDLSVDPFLYHHPGDPLELIYGSESPVRLSDVSRHLSSARKRRRPIDHIGFLGCRFRATDNAAAPFFRALGRKLRRVSVAGGLSICGMPDVGDDEVESLAPFFDGDPGPSSPGGASSLRSLDLTGSTITAGGIETGPLGRFFRRSSSLEALAVGENPGLGDDGASAVAEALACGGGRLRVLSMEGCGIGMRGASSISAYVSHPAGAMLRVLELGRNDVGNAGAGMLADALAGGRGGRSGHHRLVRLGLADAGIGDAGALSLAEALASNRSLIALSLRDNVGITDVGASGLLWAIYDETSVERIVRSNHVLSDLDLRGCGRMSPHSLEKAAHLTALFGRLPCNEGEIVRLKVSTHLENSAHGVVLEDYDLELMPHILACVGKTCGMTSLFNTLKGVPTLYTRNDPQMKCLAEDERITDGERYGEKNTTFFDRLKLSSRRSRKIYYTFVGQIPKRCSMLQHQDRRIRNGHEVAFKALSGKKNSQNKSLDSFANTDALL